MPHIFNPVQRSARTTGTPQVSTTDQEDMTTPWWQNAKAAQAILDETGTLPTLNHPTLGMWVTLNSKAFRTILHNGQLSDYAHARLNAVRYKHLLKMGYPKNGTMPKKTK